MLFNAFAWTFLVVSLITTVIAMSTILRPIDFWNWLLGVTVLFSCIVVIQWVYPYTIGRVDGNTISITRDEAERVQGMVEAE